MAGPYNPPTNGSAFQTYVALEDMNNPGQAYTGALAAGDVKVKKDTGAYANIGTLPAEDVSGDEAYLTILTATEMTADNVVIRFKDQTDPPAFATKIITLVTT